MITEELKYNLVILLCKFQEFCDDRDCVIKDNNFKYFSNYSEEFLENDIFKEFIEKHNINIEKKSDNLTK